MLYFIIILYYNAFDFSQYEVNIDLQNELGNLPFPPVFWIEFRILNYTTGIISFNIW